VPLVQQPIDRIQGTIVADTANDDRSLSFIANGTYINFA
jgi:hypothetical protein